jgi:hypothetical protein
VVIDVIALHKARDFCGLVRALAAPDNTTCNRCASCYGPKSSWAYGPPVDPLWTLLTEIARNRSVMCYATARANQGFGLTPGVDEKRPPSPDV